MYAQETGLSDHFEGLLWRGKGASSNFSSCLQQLQLWNSNGDFLFPSFFQHLLIGILCKEDLREQSFNLI